ncbi:hypothetical protein [Amycolatopsis jiangsuensis]|uniref:Uncharacterized membrane protein YdcZ (DUF606 family) n=1 Tax=Amycolatopsis jiangsuensis TaxID=1181879 RepID=A0A840IVP2_9PSEU|nr:hypothetical protein [Amycolatopsis jiangsuensis]MBB4686811.1 uncharacterized membrane protein YdcZ (DUF606 family) [Amycolatopsis jiangsuensis]
MNDPDERQQATDALAEVRTHQSRAARAARLPWWVYAAMFVLAVVPLAADDFVDLGGTTAISAVVLGLLVLALVAGALGKGVAPLSRLRGVQARRQVSQERYGLVVAIGAAVTWLLVSQGPSLAAGLADEIGLHQYRNTVTGVLFGAVLTLLFAGSQAVLNRIHRL